MTAGDNIRSLAKECVGLSRWLKSQPGLDIGESVVGFEGINLREACKYSLQLAEQICQASWQGGVAAAQLLMREVEVVCVAEPI